ncbi:hypothetical protein BDZ91DRAFT_750674 [Kalaharituber pfeilii]|nr:hypothetical protein BDZ91DRAFT_750674 [Kalaharituber pfeilii]
MRRIVSTATRHNGYYTRKWRGETILCGFLWEIQCGTINKTATQENNRRNSEQRDELVKNGEKRPRGLPLSLAKYPKFINASDNIDPMLKIKSYFEAHTRENARSVTTSLPTENETKYKT